MKKYISLIFTSLFLIVVGVCSAQVNQMDFFRSTTLRPGFHIKFWDFEEGAPFDRYIVGSAPVTYSMALSSRLSVDFVSSYFGTALEPVTGKAFEYYNMADTYGRASLILGDNLALLTLGASIPTGETEFEGNDVALAGIAANRALNNPVSSFGSGQNFSVGLAFARPLGDWVLGFGAGYSLRGEFDVLTQAGSGAASSSTFNPGEEFNLTIGAEREFDFMNNDAKFSVDVIYTNYSEDDIPDDFLGTPFLYESGDKIVLSGQVILPLGLFDPLILSAVNRIRLDNSIDSGNAVGDALLEENGGEFEFRATGITSLGKALGLRYAYRAQIYGDNGSDSEGANIHGFGGGFIMKLSRHFTFDPMFMYYTGSVNTGKDTDISLTGMELTGGFTFRF